MFYVGWLCVKLYVVNFPVQILLYYLLHLQLCPSGVAWDADPFTAVV